MYNEYLINDRLTRAKIKKEDKIAIYPFGYYGKLTKKILNEKLGIEEAVIVDNRLTNSSLQISTLSEIGNPNKYIWLSACSNVEFRSEILASLRALDIEEDRIIDLLEEKVYQEGFKVLSKIGNAQTNNYPCIEFIELVMKKKKEKDMVIVGEIGVDVGATAVEVCRQLDVSDTYYCFDFDDKIKDLILDLKMVPEICCHIEGIGNTHKVFDSYAWSLNNMVFDMRKKHLDGIFDVVYLDGAHSLIHDGLSCCLVKELIKEDGYIVFDDLQWSYGKSNTTSPEIDNLYTMEQINNC